MKFEKGTKVKYVNFNHGCFNRLAIIDEVKTNANNELYYELTFCHNGQKVASYPKHIEEIK